MTPKEKAVELVNKYLQIYDGRVLQAKQCALIAVDECIIASISFLSWEVAFEKSKEYWYKVKQEISNL